MRNTYKLFCLLLCFPIFGTVDAEEYIPITTDGVCLMLKADNKGSLKQTYFGKKIGDAVEMKKADPISSSAYSTAGTTHVFEAALRVVQADGNTSVDLKFISFESESQDANIVHTSVSLKDKHYDLFVTLHYNAYQKENIIEQWAEIRNGQKNAVKLTDFASSDLSFSAQNYFVSHFHGDWADEMNMAEQKLTKGIKIIDSKLGVRTNQFTHPAFILSLNEPASENSGEIIGGTLAWPGNFRFCFEVDNNNRLRVISGANPYASDYNLQKGELFVTPSFLFTYSNEGTGPMTRNFHHWALKYGLKNGFGERSVLLNNWEATYFDFNEEKLVGIIDDAAKMGFELFLLDDGWFGKKYPRNNDNAGLGDWTTNTDKLPHGIPFLINECRKRGIKFGLWVEPEMVNPKSELYEKHPDWVIAQPFRERTEQRNQLILDLSNPAVQEFVYQTIDGILSENKGIDYIKWDCNRYVFNGGSQYLSANNQGHLYIDYPRNLLKIMKRISEKYPDVAFMACSGGGGRIDYGSMRYFNEYWISDNGDPLQRLYTQWGTQYFFPTAGLASHVSASPSHIAGRQTPLKFRFDIAMSAKLGMDLQPAQMSEKDYDFSKKAIAEYKQIRQTVLQGDLYRLLSPYKGNRTAFMYVNADKNEAIVFNFSVRKEINPLSQNTVLQGLVPEKQYLLTEINRQVGEWSHFDKYEGKIFSGEYLMTVGLSFPMSNEYESIIIKLSEK